MRPATRVDPESGESVSRRGSAAEWTLTPGAAAKKLGVYLPSPPKPDLRNLEVYPDFFAKKLDFAISAPTGRHALLIAAGADGKVTCENESMTRFGLASVARSGSIGTRTMSLALSLPILSTVVVLEGYPSTVDPPWPRNYL